MSTVRQVVRQGVILFTWIPVAATISSTVGYVTWIEGKSMQPCLNPDSNLGWRDLIFVWKWGQRRPGALKVGDVVVIRSPEDPQRLMVKRVLGVGGDQIVPRNGSRYPDGKLCLIPPSHLWLEGDNIHSTDSNSFGPVSAGLVIGKGTRIILPPSRWGSISAGGREARADRLGFQKE